MDFMHPPRFANVLEGDKAVEALDELVGIEERGEPAGMPSPGEEAHELLIHWAGFGAGGISSLGRPVP
jgi:hypothetical protein